MLDISGTFRDKTLLSWFNFSLNGGEARGGKPGNRHHHPHDCRHHLVIIIIIIIIIIVIIIIIIVIVIIIIVIVIIIIIVGDFWGPPLTQVDPDPPGPKDCKLRGEELVFVPVYFTQLVKKSVHSRVLLLLL